ncbi:MAG: hypothetical protein M1831_007585 [Alyxoria varia]|nr:MAG: hypothetical protein M1831_007585 [Alyxoria varia]
MASYFSYLNPFSYLGDRRSSTEAHQPGDPINFDSSLPPKPPNIQQIKSEFDFAAAASTTECTTVIYIDSTYQKTLPALLPPLGQLGKTFDIQIHLMLVEELSLGDVAKAAGVKTLPTFLLFNGGEQVGIVEGPKLKTLRVFIEKIAAREAALEDD